MQQSQAGQGGQGGGAAGAPERVRREALTPGRAALITIAVLAVLLGAYVLVQVRAILILFLIGILLASAIEPVVNRLHARGFGRAQSVLLVYVGVFLVVGLLFALLVPALSQEMSRLLSTAPNLIDNLRASVQASQSRFIRDNGPYLLDQIGARLNRADIPTEQAINLASYVPSILGYFVKGLISVVTVLMVGFYWLTEKPIIKRLFLSLFADERRARVVAIWDDIEVKLGGWIRGQLILMGVIGVLASTGFALLGVRFWLLLGILAGVCELVPFIGPWIIGLPAVLLALSQSWRLALAVIVFLAALYLIEGNVLVPRVMKGTIGLSPLLVVLAVLVAITVLGPVGAIVAIPVAAALQVLIGDLVRTHQEALAVEGRGRATRVFRWRPVGLPRRLQNVAPGPAVVSPVVELSAPPVPRAEGGADGADGLATLVPPAAPVPADEVNVVRTP